MGIKVRNSQKDIPYGEELKRMVKLMEKKKIAVVFGGESSEHDISCISAGTIIENINRDQYDIRLIGITKDGRWLLVDSGESIKDGSWRDSKVQAAVLPDKKNHGIMIYDGNSYSVEYIDVIFPILHGLYGEDGTIQGLFELSGIPYVGCGVLASSAGMDKLTTKRLVDTLHIRQAECVAVFAKELTCIDKVVEKIESKLDYPVFVKPSNAGSSKGVSKAKDREALITAIKEAAVHDGRILVEETIVGREIECAVMSRNGENVAAGVGEILAAADFYDFDAKYNNADSRTVVNPKLPDGVKEKIMEAAVRIFEVIDGYGLSRVDFFLEKGSNDIVFNEINTMPGFTSISMYPMIWKDAGVEVKELVNLLIENACVRKDR